MISSLLPLDLVTDKIASFLTSTDCINLNKAFPDLPVVYSEFEQKHQILAKRFRQLAADREALIDSFHDTKCIPCRKKHSIYQVFVTGFKPSNKELGRVYSKCLFLGKRGYAFDEPFDEFRSRLDDTLPHDLCMESLTLGNCYYDNGPETSRLRFSNDPEMTAEDVATLTQWLHRAKELMDDAIQETGDKKLVRMKNQIVKVFNSGLIGPLVSN